ncbi:LysM peptidoglycan-binding domain-containing protein [Catalinimonas niigatensis]|uniref:LysM peptidoglycan-binding domain-containing protein n=1 Tax=Catalinimonas niigatensis TaxID=1397264 RepID=UPI002666CB50|nr:LysM peptidoglycan-binding domain-containing protein [Catalinimonas niigatensis]WPP48503.1 LysM peptidoglycan-binding domain-containing protein [Catalinimonas niigatensis]
MQCKILVVFILVGMFCITQESQGFPATQHFSSGVFEDSVGIDRIAGEVYIIHRVFPGETLFALSRKYNTQLDEIRKINSSVDVDNLSIGDSLRVPLFPQLSQGEKTIHTVKEGETLFRISRTYNVSMDELRRWNAIGDQALSIGQPIVIYHIGNINEVAPQPMIDEKRYVVHTVRQGETLFAISRSYGVSVNELIQRNRLSNESIAFGQTLIIRDREVLDAAELNVSASNVNTVTIPDPVTDNRNNIEEEDSEEEEVYDRRLTRAEALEQEKERIRAIRASEKKALSEYEKKSEMGFASAIEGGIDTKKFLALHRSAPVGTIIQIRNEMNNLSVFVRVVGKLPETGVNNKVSIRISQAAYEKLGGINERFPVEITYIQ